MKTKEITTGRCTINHWQNLRRFAFTKNKVSLEVSAGFCTCSTCSQRYEGFLRTLQRKQNIKFIFEYYEYSYETIGCGTVTNRSRWVTLDLPKNTDALEFLRTNLEVQIDNVSFYPSDYFPKSFKK
jgi:hypothetical protein